MLYLVFSLSSPHENYLDEPGARFDAKLAFPQELLCAQLYNEQLKSFCISRTVHIVHLMNLERRLQSRRWIPLFVKI